MSELEELQVEIHGVLLELTGAGDKGLDDTAEIEKDQQDAPRDGDAQSELRIGSREIELETHLLTGDGIVTDGDHDEFAAALQELRLAVGVFPDRTLPRLLRWRRIGEVTKQIMVEPAVGKPLGVPGDWNRQIQAAAEIGIRLTAPDPVILSDAVHTHTFTAGETFEVVNAGSHTAIGPTSWSLESDVPVTIENLTYGESVTFPYGPVTVNRQQHIEYPDEDDAYGLCFGPLSTDFPRYPYLRPGSNMIRASAVCVLSWQDSW